MSPAMFVSCVLWGVLAALVLFNSTPSAAAPATASGCSVSVTNIDGITKTISNCMDAQHIQHGFRGQVLQQWIIDDMVCIVGTVNGVIAKECRKGLEPFHPMTPQEAMMIEDYQRKMDERNRQIRQQVLRTQAEVNMRMREMSSMQQKMQHDINQNIRNMQMQMANMQATINQQVRSTLRNIFG